MRHDLVRVIKRAIGIAVKDGASGYPEGQAFHPAACLADAALEIGGEELHLRLWGPLCEVAVRGAVAGGDPILGYTREQCLTTLRRALSNAQEMPA